MFVGERISNLPCLHHPHANQFTCTADTQKEGSEERNFLNINEKENSSNYYTWRLTQSGPQTDSVVDFNLYCAVCFFVAI